MSNNKRPNRNNFEREEPVASAGTPRFSNRNFNRRAAYNRDKAGDNWEDQAANDDKAAAAAGRTPKQRPQRFRKFSNKPQKAEGPIRSETPSASQNAIIYEGQARGGRAVAFVNSHNFSYSAFPNLVREMHTLLTSNETTLARALPYCVFQHYLATILNATIIKRSIVSNVEQRFTQEVDPFEVISADRMWVPVPFQEYLNGIGPSLTASGDKVYLNLPTQGVPRLAVDINDVHVTSGSFGTCNAENHNAYEDYVSPLVTSNLVIRTLAASVDHNYNAWDPIPGLSPAEGVATPNLLGYELPERIRSETANILQRFRFADSATMAGRLRHSPELMEHVSSILLGRSDKFNVTRGISADPGVNTAAFIVSEVQIDLASTEPLAVRHGTLSDHEQFSASSANMATLFTYKRRRNNDAPGHCFLAGNAVIDGWDATINSNFDMTFQPTYGIDFPHLRTQRFEEAAPTGSRDADTRLWLDKVFRISP